MNPNESATASDLYETLQVSPGAAPEVIEAAYRGLSKKYGSDPDPAVRERRRELDRAYNVLSDASQRAEYDQARAAGSARAAKAAGPAQAAAPPEKPTGAETSTSPGTWPRGVVACPRNPEVETALRCSRCEAPICPKCLIQTPVGARCRDCARMSKSPVYTVNGAALVRAVGAAIIGGVVMGIAWGLLTRNVVGLGGFFSIFVGAGLGYVFTRVMEAATRRKRGPVVVACAMGGIVLAFAIQYVLVYENLLIGSLIALGVALYFAYQNLR